MNDNDADPHHDPRGRSYLLGDHFLHVIRIRSTISNLHARHQFMDNTLVSDVCAIVGLEKEIVVFRDIGNGETKIRRSFFHAFVGLGLVEIVVYRDHR